jgi:hypothetical protein
LYGLPSIETGKIDGTRSLIDDVEVFRAAPK